METKEFNQLLNAIRYDTRAVEKLYSFYYKRIVFFLSKTYGLQLAEDVAQEFFISLFDKSQNQEYIKSPTAWVYTCCQNIAKRKISFDSRYASLTENKDNATQPVIGEEQYGDLYGIIKQLDDISQKIIAMYYWQGYNLLEIADILDIKPATVRKKHTRVLKKLKNQL